MRYASYVLVGTLILVATATLAVAGEAAGHNIVVQKPQTTTELPNNKVYITIGNSQVCLMTDPDHPLNDATGDCDGGCVAEAGGVPVCMGSCTWVDTEGDMVFFNWDGNTAAGTWSLKGGTGKWAKASGSGTWEATGAFVNGMARNSWSGTMEME